MATKTKLKTEGDLVLHAESNDYCFVSAPIKNPEASDAISIADPIGYPVKKSGTDWVPIVATDEANAIGVIAAGDAISALAAAASTTAKYKILELGPAVVIEESISTDDYNAVAFTVATIVTALDGLTPKVKSKKKPTKTETGTT